ncbi:MAG: hypothetical protein ACRD34_03550, partial [Bryobacteraceae bacterium]
YASGFHEKAGRCQGNFSKFLTSIYPSFRMRVAEEAEAGSAGEHPAKEYSTETHRDEGRRQEKKNLPPLRNTTIDHDRSPHT